MDLNDLTNLIQHLLNESEEQPAEQTFSPAHNDTEARQQVIDLITRRPQDYKVCCGCESVVRERAPVCPRCNAYRFENDPRTVVAHTLELAKKEPTEIFS